MSWDVNNYEPRENFLFESLNENKRRAKRKELRKVLPLTDEAMIDQYVR